MAALLANRGDAGNGFAAAAQVSAFARQIHPRLVALRRDDGLIHRAVAIINGLYFIVNAGRVTLRPEITRRFAERTFDDAASRFQHAFDDDFSVGRDQQIVAESFRRDQPQRFTEIAADDVVLADFERPAVAGAHVERRMVAQYRGDRHVHVVLFVILEDLPQVTRRRI